MSPKVQKLEGRPHIVVPVVMGVAGVWDGSNGPLLYAADDLKASVPLWNGKPVVVYHPDMRTNCTAGHPDVFNRQRVGTIFNARFDGSRLKAEAWLDPERLTVIAPKVLASVKNGLMMEVSTGLFTENQPMPGRYDGVPYTAIARNHRPDHLAILPDQIGACSIAMGAGLCRNTVTRTPPAPPDPEVEPLLTPSLFLA